MFDVLTGSTKRKKAQVLLTNRMTSAVLTNFREATTPGTQPVLQDGVPDPAESGRELDS